MGSRAMKFLSVALAVLASASLAGAQNKYLCPGGESEKTITVNNKAKLTFLVAKKTPHNMDCEAKYVMGSCSRIKLQCAFKMRAKGKACKGDKAVITNGGKTITLCNKKGKYKANVKGAFTIKVVTDAKVGSKGGNCKIRCTKKGKPKPTTTTAAPTPPPTTVPGTESPLANLQINPDTIAISGFSSGAAFSNQFHVAFSKTISGMGAFAGIRYIQDVSDGDIASLTNSLASQGLIDPVENISNDNIYIFHGQADSVVPWEQASKIKNFYQNFLAEGSNIEIKDDIMGEHGFPTNDQGGFCLFLNSPNFVNNCNYDGAFHILQKTLGEVVPKADDGYVDYELKDFDQAEFFEDSDAEGNSLDKNGYAFIPDSCVNGSVQCHLRVHLHGCTQTREWIGDGYIRGTGFLPLAKANNIVMLFPQIKANAANPNGCWNFWGYLGDADNYQFATKQGKQMKAMAKMVEKTAQVSMF